MFRGCPLRAQPGAAEACRIWPVRETCRPVPYTQWALENANLPLLLSAMALKGQLKIYEANTYHGGGKSLLLRTAQAMPSESA